MPALTGYEQGLILRTALAARPLKRAIVVLDFTGFGGAPGARHPLAGPLPTYLYDRNPFNDFPYLLSWAGAREVVADRRSATRPSGSAPTRPRRGGGPIRSALREAKCSVTSTRAISMRSSPNPRSRSQRCA